MKHYVYFVLIILTILCIGSVIICMMGAFVERQVYSGANYIAGLVFFGIVSFLVMAFSIMWGLDSWYNLQRAINRSK